MTKHQSLILVVDAEPSSKSTITSFLKDRHFTVLVAESAPKAIAVIKEMQPDVIVANISLPAVSGLEFLTICKGQFATIPFIFLADHSTIDQIPKALQQGAWDCLVQPIKPVELLEHSLYRAMEKARLIKAGQKKAGRLKKCQSQEKRNMHAVMEWRSTVDSFPEMIAIVDSNSKIHRFNQAMLDFLGKTGSEAKGADCFFCNDSHQETHHLVIKTQKAKKVECFLKDTGKHLMINIVPYSPPDGEVVGAIHVFHDISHQKQAEREKELLYAKLLQTQKLEAVGQLAAGIAHEINTPTQYVSSNLTFIQEAFTDISRCLNALEAASKQNNLSHSQLIEEFNKMDWEYLQDEAPAAITQSTEGLSRVISIVQAMKEFSHPGQNKFELIDINNLINVTTVVARNEWKHVAELSLHLDPQGPEIYCMPGEIGQVVLNLLINASHSIADKIHQSTEDTKGSINVRTQQNDDYLDIIIEDDGNGVPQSIQDKIFDPFFTTKEVGKGTGQGLAIAHDVISNKHKGKLRFTSTQGVGTTFFIHLPLQGQP